MSITRLLTGSLDNSANIATRDQFVSSFKNVFGITDDVNLSIADIQAGSKQYEMKSFGTGKISPSDIAKAKSEVSARPTTPKSATPRSVVPNLTGQRSTFYEAAEKAQGTKLPYNLRQSPDAVEHQRMMNYEDQLNTFNKNIETRAQAIADARTTPDIIYGNISMPNQDILDPIQKGLREGNFMTEQGMKALKENVESGLGPYVGSSRAGEMSGGTFTRFLSGTEPNSSMLKTVGGLGALGLIGGGANVMAGGDFSTGAMTTFGAASLLRGGGKLYNEMLGSFEKNTMQNILKASKGGGEATLAAGRTERLKQMQDLKFSETNKASKKMRDKLIKERTGTSAMNTRALTIGGGMLAGVAFTGRSDKRDYRRGFNKHRGNRI